MQEVKELQTKILALNKNIEISKKELKEAKKKLKEERKKEIQEMEEKLPNHYAIIINAIYGYDIKKIRDVKLGRSQDEKILKALKELAEKQS